MLEWGTAKERDTRSRELHLSSTGWKDGMSSSGSYVTQGTSPLAHFAYTARRRNREKNGLAVTQYKPESAVDYEQSQCSRSQAFHPTRA